jgi:hypothetical protein
MEDRGLRIEASGLEMRMKLEERRSRIGSTDLSIFHPRSSILNPPNLEVI